jgi:hypothetical protein
MKECLPLFNSNMWLTCIVVDPANAGFTREELRLAMEQENIETRPLWKPMHLQPVFADAPFYGDASGVSESLFDRGLCLPSHPINAPSAYITHSNEAMSLHLPSTSPVEVSYPGESPEEQGRGVLYNPKC